MEENMKKCTSIALVLSLAMVVIGLASCKKGTKPEDQQVQKKQITSPVELAKYIPKLTKGLEYDKYSTTGTWLQANVFKKGGKERAMWFQLFDRSGDQKSKDFYKTATGKVAGKYAAIIAKDMHVWILCNNAEIRLMGESNDYKKTDKLIKFIESFNLAGLEKI